MTAKNTQQPDQPGRRRLIRYLRALASCFRTQLQSTNLSGKTGLDGDPHGEIRNLLVQELLRQFTDENSAFMTLLQSLIS
ncbi:hypothetical protein [Streptomyces cinereoruber]|uniref:hypothetical protein n=1 Tax=Streptomyces cinereoruber TaxID=67260 RepID=UPI00362BE992